MEPTWSPEQPWVFERTPWSRIRGFSETPRGSARVLEGICRRYWRPVYHCLRKRGSSESDAEDLTQAFFAYLIKKDAFVAALDESRGSFRGYLRTALRRFCINQWRKDSAGKRGGVTKPMEMDAEGMENCPELADSTWDPGGLFERAWAEDVIRTALERLQEEMKTSGRRSQYEKLKGLLFHPPEQGDYARLSAELRMSARAISMHVLRLRKRCREIVEELIGEDCASQSEVREEMAALVRILTTKER